MGSPTDAVAIPLRHRPGMDTSSDRLFTPAFIALTISELAYFTAGGLLIGVTPFFVTGPLGADQTGVGWTFAAFSVTTLTLRPYAGRLADRRGRRPMLIFGALLCAVTMLGHVATDDLAVVVGLRLLLGVAEACYFVACIAALADLAPPGRTGEALSYNSLALYLGLAFGPMIGQALMGIGGFGATWSGGFALALLAAVLAARLPETRPAIAPPTPIPTIGDVPRAQLIHRPSIGPGLALLAGVSAMSGFLLLAGMHAERLGLDAWSVTFLVFGGVVVAGRIAFARLPDRVPPLRVVGIALALCAVGAMVAAAAAGVLELLLGSIVLAAGMSLLTPAVFAAIFRTAAPAERGTAAGTATLFIDLGFGAGPLVLGYVASVTDVPSAFAVAGLIAFSGAAGTILATRSRRPLPSPA
jgi:MFS family permease